MGNTKPEKNIKTNLININLSNFEEKFSAGGGVADKTNATLNIQ